jgi:5-methylcytosine-specific restriction endonuclease McrA
MIGQAPSLPTGGNSRPELSPVVRPSKNLPDLAPRCGRCKRRHLPTLRCWAGKYAMAITRHVLATQGRTCWMCGRRATSSDHVQARSYGGDDSDDNLRPSCADCNARRGNAPNPFKPEPEPGRSGAGLSDRWRGATLDPGPVP